MSEPFVSECCEGERCCFEGCSAQAEHKVEETIFHDDPLQIRHELTAYICHEPFRQIMGPAADRAPGRTPRDFRIPAQQERWQPIETAPLDPIRGPPLVMLWVEGGGHKGVGTHAFGRCYRSHDGNVRGVASGFSGNWSIRYWMPLQAGPALPSTDDGGK